MWWRKNRVVDVEARSVWGSILWFSTIMFFISLADAVLSNWVPEFMQKMLGSPLLMGLVFSFSSVVGFLADLVLPQLVNRFSFQRLLVMAIGGGIVFAGVLLWSVEWPVIAVFLLAMTVWGIYYEFIAFGSQQFVVESVPVRFRSGSWAVSGIFRSLAYFLGPLVGSLIVIKYGDRQVLWFASLISVIAFVAWKLVGYNKERDVALGSVHRPNVLLEAKHWWVLAERVWPVLIISFFLGLIDATFWTTGAVLSVRLANESWWGSMFLSLYMLPPLFMGLMVARWGIFEKKKKIAEISLLIAGVFLAMVGMGLPLVLMLLCVVLMSVALTVSFPLTDAVYTDLLSRMGRERLHMAGLSSSVVSLAYIVGPIVAGWWAGEFGERQTFGILGGITVVVALFLLCVTPKKLKLPQREIDSWK